MQRLILKLEQARDIQRGNADWLELSAILLSTTIPETTDNLPDPERTSAALRMMEMGCEDEQVAEQLMWKPRGSTLKSMRKLHNGRR